MRRFSPFFNNRHFPLFVMTFPLLVALAPIFNELDPAKP
jgi:hypothetical protein